MAAEKKVCYRDKYNTHPYISLLHILLQFHILKHHCLKFMVLVAFISLTALFAMYAISQKFKQS